MKRHLLLGLALIAGLWSTAAVADVDVFIGAGVPGVVIGTQNHSRAHRHYHPPVRHHHYQTPMLRHHQYQHPTVRHRHYGPPVVYYPEKVYRHSHKHYAHPHYRHHKNVRPPVGNRHMWQAQRPLRPPHAYAHGHWRR